MKLSKVPDYQDIYPLFGGALAFIKFAEVEEIFKFILTIVVIGYTLTKWAYMIIDRKTKKHNKDEKD